MTPSNATGEFMEAILSRDFARARGLLHPEIDFRGMTPNRIWEAEGPTDVEDVLRTWLDDPDEDVTGIDATEGAFVEDTRRLGWRVRGINSEGPFVYEQQAFAREAGGRIVWLRVMCSGPRPVE